MLSLPMKGDRADIEGPVLSVARILLPGVIYAPGAYWRRAVPIGVPTFVDHPDFLREMAYRLDHAGVGTIIHIVDLHIGATYDLETVAVARFVSAEASPDFRSSGVAFNVQRFQTLKSVLRSA